MIREVLYVDEKTGIVRKAKFLERLCLNDEPFKPNGMLIFVDPDTNFLEEGQLPRTETESMVNLTCYGKHYTKKGDFLSNGNRVLFHPERKELAEVAHGYRPGSWTKVKDLYV